MNKITQVKSVHTGDLCFNCRDAQYWWRLQIETTDPEGIVNICVCNKCSMLSADELMEPILRKE